MYDAVKSKESPDYYQFLFNKTKEDFAKDHLFDENETIKIRENSFEQIVKELQVYNLSTTSDDVKGIAFEQFLGRTFRGELGQFSRLVLLLILWYLCLTHKKVSMFVILVVVVVDS